MAPLFDPVEYLVLPGGSATTRSSLKPCSCKCVQFEIAVEVRKDKDSGDATERIALRCVDCFAKRPARRILGWVDMLTHKVTEAPCRTTTAS